MGKVADRSSTAWAGTNIKTPEDLDKIFGAYRNKRQEHFLVATLTGAHTVIRVYVVSIGTVNKAITAGREVFYPAILDNASRVALAHNHPSGKAEPSKEDDRITETMVKAGELLGILVLDHIILTKTGFFSYARSGKVGGLAAVGLPPQESL
jgi:DNA repair protein RadC